MKAEREEGGMKLQASSCYKNFLDDEIRSKMTNLHLKYTPFSLSKGLLYFSEYMHFLLQLKVRSNNIFFFVFKFSFFLPSLFDCLLPLLSQHFLDLENNVLCNRL